MPDEPFAQFARHYDQFMLRFVDYKSWVDYVERIFKKHKVTPKTVLDVACGTGIPTVMMAQRGYRMKGVDRSPEMLAVLRSKGATLPIETTQADVRDFDLTEPADAAISLYDSINYLLKEEDLRRCFGCVRKALADGGLFVFDMNTIYGLSEFWGNRITPRNVGDIHSVWENTYDREAKVSTLHLTFWQEGEGNSEPPRFEEVHRERAYSRREVKRCLEASGFSRVSFYNHGSFLPVGPLTTRMMVVTR